MKKMIIAVLFTAIFAVHLFSQSGSLTMVRNNAAIIITSTAPPTWKLAFGIVSSKGGGSTIGLFRPANSTQNLSGQTGMNVIYGLDNLEWRYIENSRGIRAGINTASISNLEILEETPARIVIRITGSWQNITNFVRTITVTPYGFTGEITAPWTGGSKGKSMWWLFTNLRESAMDGNQATVRDADTGPVKLPIKWEGIYSLPSGINLPYTIRFPLIGNTQDGLELTVYEFADKTSHALGYEYSNKWTWSNGYWTYFPRWVSNFRNTTYRFKYQWKLSEGGQTPNETGSVDYRMLPAIYPNPMNAHGPVIFRFGQTPDLVSVFNATGRLIDQFKNPAGSVIQWQKPGVANSLYLVESHFKGRVCRKKITIIK
jgi:hypothetical protein